MKMRFSTGCSAALSFALAAYCGATPTLADPVPLPTVDYEVTATVMGKNGLVLHHSGGKARAEMQMANMPQITSIVDINARKMYMIGAIPGMSNTAIEVGIGDHTNYGQVIGNGRRVGTATVAGESCDLWEMDKSKDGATQVTVCLSSDHIPLRTEVMMDGKPRVTMEVTEIKRVPQDPSLFVLPANVQVMKMPKGMGSILGSPIGQ